MPPKNSGITVTDQFCGAGGSSLGAHALGLDVRLAMNHWDLAIETHNTNFPDTDHVLADISQVDPRRYPSTDILITSPECTNHSLAKGKARKNIGQLELWGSGNRIDPAEERSRATMWDVPRFAEHHDYNCIIAENVVDARYWRLWDAWLHAMELLDYDHEIVYFNSMFAPGVPQSRDRMYVVFWKRGNHRPNLTFTPAAYCERCGEEVSAAQAWKKSFPWGRYNKQYTYRCPQCHAEVTPHFTPASAAINWDNLGQRVGDRKRPLKPRTLERIQYGLEKFAAPAVVPQPFLVGYYTRSSSPAVTSMQEPMPTQSTQPRHYLAVPPFVVGYYSKPAANTVYEPMPTLPTQQRHYLAVPPYIIELRRTGKARSITEPLATVVASGNHHGLITPPQQQEISVEDVHFRMLQPDEIGRAMAFPDEYTVLGNKRQRVRQYGNAVTPPVMTMLLDRCVESLAS